MISRKRDVGHELARSSRAKSLEFKSGRDNFMKKISVMSVMAIALVTSGCAFRSQTVGMAMDHNDFVADTTNGQTVLNILRAREREPMHFTSFSKVVGNVAATGAISTNLVANGNGGSSQVTSTTATKSGPGSVLIDQTVTGQDVAGRVLGATNVTPQISLQVNTGTSFDIAINANDEFYKGILGTLPNSLLVHYLRQGFPADLLSHLTIGKMQFYAEVAGPGGVVERELLLEVTNTPDEPDKIAVFDAAMKCRHLSFAPDNQSARSLPLSSPDALSAVAPELVGRLRGATASGPYSFETPSRNDYKIALSEPSDIECLSIRSKLAAMFKAQLTDRPFINNGLGTRQSASPPNGKLLTTTTEINTDGRNSLMERENLRGQGGATFEAKGFFNNQLKAEYSGNLVIEISFRSIEGVLYYLGEYARNTAPTPKLKSSTCPDNDSYCLPIIRIAPASEVKLDRRWVTVNYRGQRYSVPISGAKLDSEGGRSSQTISLVQQLLNLTRTAKELPSTPSVRIVN